jgi:aerobic carbon-monoxide dehydrogenase large subunit
VDTPGHSGPAAASDAASHAASAARPQGVGRSVLRVEDRRLLDGQGEYLADIQLPGMLEVAFLRSPVAHARLNAVRVPEAHAGRVLTAADLAFVRPIVADGASPSFRHSEYPPLASGKLRFVGEMIALCVADTRAQAEDIASACELDIEELPALWDIDAARAPDAARVHEDWPDNVFVTGAIDTGDLARAREQATIRVEHRVRMGRHAGVSLETRGVLAYFDKRMDELVVYSSTQFPHVIRTVLAQALGIAESRLRVIAPDVGGGFGPKNNFQPEELAVAAAAMKLGRPVRWVEDRREHFIASPHAREHRYHLVAHADRSGRLLALEAEVVVDAGAYSVWPWTAGMEAGMSAGIMTGPYDIAVYRGRAVTVCTNKSPLGPYRGVGRSGACFAIESLIDRVAQEVGLPPETVRETNMVRAAQMPYVSATGKHYDSGDYPECARRALAELDVAALRTRQARGEADGRLIGFGMASYTEQSAHGTKEWVARGLPVVFGYEPALARFTPDGKLILHVGIQNHGQGLETTLAQVAHEELGIDVADVVVRHGDTAISPYGMGTFASRSMTMAGGAVSRACAVLAEKLKRIAAHQLGATAQDVVLAAGAASANGRSLALSALCEAAFLHPERLPPGEPPALEAFEVYEPGRSTGAFSYATHACALAVDPHTGQIEILDYVVCHDCGTMVNPMIVEAQVTGGVAQGLGTALYEEIPYDRNGQPLASTFLDYLIPGFADVPDVRVIHMQTPSPHTRFGIKGMGEGGAIAPPAAVLNAVNDALRSLRAQVSCTPITPDAVLAAIVEAEGGAR